MGLGVCGPLLPVVSNQVADHAMANTASRVAVTSNREIRNAALHEVAGRSV
jgi:hypothetical protein